MPSWAYPPCPNTRGDEVHLQTATPVGVPQTVLSESNGPVGDVRQHREVPFGTGTGQVVDDTAVGGRRHPGGGGPSGAGRAASAMNRTVSVTPVVGPGPRPPACVHGRRGPGGPPGSPAPPASPCVPCPGQAGARAPPSKVGYPTVPFRQDFPLRPLQAVDADGQVLGRDGAQMARG
jgi:hypothetical protein